MKITKIYEEGNCAYIFGGVALVFDKPPTLDLLDIARKLINQVTDDLINDTFR
jgi:hypothetical protein